MQIEFNEQEAKLILGLLNSPIQIAPQAMQEYLGLLNGIAAKLQPNAQVAPNKEGD